MKSLLLTLPFYFIGLFGFAQKPPIVLPHSKTSTNIQPDYLYFRVSQNWNEADSVWEDGMHRYWEKNPLYQNIEMRDEFPTESPLNPMYLISYEYDAQNRLTGQETGRRFFLNGMWYNESYITYFYENLDDTKPKEYTYHIWVDSSNTYNPYYKIISAFNQQKQVSQDTVVILRDGQTVYYSIHYYQYNAQNKETELLSKQVSQNGDLINYRKVNTSYLSDTLPSEITTSLWDTTLQKWVYDAQDKFEYNSEGYCTSKTLYYWISSSQSFKPVAKTEYQHDSNNQLIVETSQLIRSNGDYKNDRRYIYAYLNHSGIEFVTETNAAYIYPNPCSEGFKIKFPKESNAKNKSISIYALNGSLIQHQHIDATNEATVRLPNLASGTYMVFLSIGDQNEIHKVVIQE